MSSTSSWLLCTITTRSYFSVVFPAPDPKTTCAMPPVADGVVMTDLVVHSGSWPPPNGSGALTTPSTALLNWVTSLAVSGHAANTSSPDEPASQVVNIASPAQLAGVQAGYIIDATTFSSPPVAAAVDSGAAEGVTVAA